MGDFDATIAAAGYRETDISQEHAPQKKRGGRQSSRDQNKKKEHMRAEKEEGGVGPSWPGTQTLQRKDTWDARDGWFRCNDCSCWLSGHRYHPRTCTSEKGGGSQLSRDPTKRKSTWDHRKQRVGRVPVVPGPKRKEREHMRAEKEGVGESQLRRDSNIANEGHMRCNRWMISMQRLQLLAIGTPISPENIYLRKRGRVPVKPGTKPKRIEHIRA